jgi:hypothetical protein
MQTEQIYTGLKELAEKLNITVTEKNLSNAGVKVKSGLCRIEERNLFIMDKNKPIKEKIKLLAESISELPLEEVYIVPTIRETLEKYRKRKEEGP